MALSQSALSDLLDALRAGGGLDVVREALALVLQALIDAEATQQIGAQPYERSASRTCGCQLFGPPYATCAYSWISPPSRSRPTTVPAGTKTAGSPDPSGAACPKARCGRCTL